MRLSYLAVIVLLLAGGTFLLDVVSPSTPTPQTTVLTSLLCIGLSALVFVYHFAVCKQGASGRVPEASDPQSNPGSLIPLVCARLC